MPHLGQLCCNQGKNALDPLPPLPDRMTELLTGDSVEAKRFQENTRYFNSGMAMGSVKATDASVRTGGPSSYRVCGQMYRRVGPLRESDNTDPCCGQTYYHDPEFQAMHRATRNNGGDGAHTETDKRIFALLREILQDDANNTLIAAYQTINEYIDTNNLDPKDYCVALLDKVPNGEHPGRYNLPTAPEIALLMLDDVPSNNTRNKTIVVSVKDGGTQNELQFSSSSSTRPMSTYV